MKVENENVEQTRALHEAELRAARLPGPGLRVPLKTPRNPMPAFYRGLIALTIGSQDYRDNALRSRLRYVRSIEEERHLESGETVTLASILPATAYEIWGWQVDEADVLELEEQRTQLKALLSKEGAGQAAEGRPPSVAPRGTAMTKPVAGRAMREALVAAVARSGKLELGQVGSHHRGA